MLDNDVIIFFNDENDVISFVKKGVFWECPSSVKGFPTDAQIREVQDSGRKWIHIRGGMILGKFLG